MAQRYLRLAPVYYAVFLYGWFLGSQVNPDKPWWYTYRMGFCDCEHYYWSVFTMSINEFPGYVVANEGCFYWGWYVAAEMQIYLVIPIVVWVLEVKIGRGKEANVTCAVILGFFTCIGMIINWCIIYGNDMSAGLFSPQDILIYKLWLNKAYTKVPPVCLGLLLARIYLSINVEKQKGKTSFEVYRRYSPLKGVMATLLGFAAIALIGLISIAPLSVNKAPPSWSRLKSAIYIVFAMPVFCLCLMAIFTMYWLGYYERTKRFFARRFWAVPGRLSYCIYLLFPIVAGQFSSAMTSPLYLTYNEMFYQMIFDIIGSFLAAMLLYLFIEKPLSNIIFGSQTPVRKNESLDSMIMPAGKAEARLNILNQF